MYCFDKLKYSQGARPGEKPKQKGIHYPILVFSFVTPDFTLGIHGRRSDFLTLS